MNKEIVEFQKCISNFTVKGKGIPYTHTDCGPPWKKYDIPANKMKKFHNYYSKVLNKIDLHITEKPKEVSCFTIDIDFKFDNKDSERQYNNKNTKYLIGKYLEKINEYFTIKKKDKISFLFEKNVPSFDAKNKQYKDGFHIIFPNIALNKEMKYIISDEVKTLVEKDNDINGFSKMPFINSYDDIFDVAVLGRNNWCMYGSKKHNGKLYRLTAIYDYKLKEKSMNKYTDKKLVRLLSVRKYDPDNIVEINKNVKEIEWGQKIKQISSKYNLNKKKKKKTKEIQLIDINDISLQEENINKSKKILFNENGKEAHKLIKLLSTKRANDYNLWIQVMWCLHNIDTQLFEDAIEFSKNCTSKFDYEYCIKVWDDARDDGFNLPSLRNWAKTDNPKEYEKVIEESLDPYIKEAESGTHYDIAKVIYCIYKDKYKCTSLRHSTWYEFQPKKHKWVMIEGGYTLENLISEEITTRFAKLNASYYQLASTNQGIDRDNLIKKAERIHKIINDLKKANFKGQVMNQCSKIFIDSDFEETLDSKRDLIGFNNGVYDLEKGIFRDGTPDDRITFTTGYDYQTFKDNDPIITLINNYFNDVQTEKDMRSYILTLLASYLNGHTKEQKFVIWTGGGANGKSTTVELFQYSFGEYCGTIPITLLTKSKGSSSGASPEVANTRGKRFIIFQEPEKNDQIHVGYMKELTGGDWIYARALFREPVRFKPQFKLLLTCNKLPHIPSDDKGTWRRLRVTPWESEFLDHDKKPAFDKRQYFKDYELNDKIKVWASAFMWMLLTKWYPIYMKHGLKEPNKVKMYTDKYQKDSDIYLEFISENLVFTSSERKKKDYENISIIYATFKNWYRESYASKNCPSKKDLRDYFINHKYSIIGNTLYGVKFQVSDEKTLVDGLDNL